MIDTKENTRPTPTTDMALAKSNLDEFGYAFVANALTPAQVEAARSRLLEQAAAEKLQGLAYEDGGPEQNWGSFLDEQGRIRENAFTETAGGVNQRVWMLVNKGKIFRDMLSIESVHSLVSHVIGEAYLLSSFTANIAKPGGVAMDLHTDQWWMPNPVYRDQASLAVGSITRESTNLADDAPAPMIAPAACVNVMWMLVDFTADNGGTRLVPRSHLYGVPPAYDDVRTDEIIAAEGPAGSAMIFDGRLWHGTGANVSDVERLGLLTTFCGPMFRPQENFTVGLAPKVYEEASPELLALLGFKIWSGYGRIETPATDFISHRESSLAELYLKKSVQKSGGVESGSTKS